MPALVIEAVIVNPFGQAAPDICRSVAWRPLHSRLCVGSVATVRFAGNALERLAVVLDTHQLAGVLIALLPVSIGPLKLSPTCHRSAPEPISRVFRHAFYPFRLLVALRR
jgi:hypothetical protein